MYELEKVILVATGRNVETKVLTDDKNANTILLNEICDKMRRGSVAAFYPKIYEPCFLFKLVSDVYNKYPELVDLKAVHDHIQQYEAWAIEESGKAVKEIAEKLCAKNEEVDS